MKGGGKMSKDDHKHSFKENLTEQKEEAGTVRKIVAIILFSLILIVVIGGFSGYTYIKNALKPVDSESKEQIEVEIPLGSSTSQIANILEENDVIKDARVFRFYIKFKNKADFQAGTYTISQANSLEEITEILKSGKVMEEAVHTITIPEGRNVEQIASIYEKELSFSKEEFIDKMEDEEYMNELIELYPALLTDEILDEDIRYPLEGYLYGATYSFYETDPSIEDIVEQMLDKSVDIMKSHYDAIVEKDMTVHEAFTFASVVENEATTKEQRIKIAGVFYNRMEEGMKLQTDPTVQYARGEHKERLTYDDLEVESPYNTYYIEGLPIGPISNFAENALEAVVDPEDSDYLYFLHDFEGDIHYSKTNDEHNEKKKKYRSDDDKEKE